MMEVYPVTIENHTFTAVTVKLPHTNLLVISNEVGYVMCGALDVKLLTEKLADRPIVAGRAVGVKTINDLKEASLDSVTDYAKSYGWQPGMKVKEALLRIAQ
ncbi:YunC family protein [Gracilibacillus alcaliphilus]|uniref:YunC family protein n=1 Tax=Gracilibacillus alcaliphilus TaxID=1401441 RepID=UPI00195CC9F2|nr:DUF1805 domain-containing protein [Gracilibacillus alcaliphilus]